MHNSFIIEVVALQKSTGTKTCISLFYFSFHRFHLKKLWFSPQPLEENHTTCKDGNYLGLVALLLLCSICNIIMLCVNYEQFFTPLQTNSVCPSWTVWYLTHYRQKSNPSPIANNICELVQIVYIVVERYLLLLSLPKGFIVISHVKFKNCLLKR